MSTITPADLNIGPYHLSGESLVGAISPSIVIFEELMEANIDEMIRIAGSPERLRPHCKTHKMAEVVRKLIARGITKHKCATFAEAEMLAQAGAKDIFLAYTIVGPNIERTIRFRQQYPHVALSVAADHPAPVTQLGQVAAAAGVEIDVVLDLDSGQHRTGAAGEAAAELYRLIAQTNGLRPAGLHLYDGQNHQTDLEERRAAVKEVWRQGVSLRDQLVAEGLDVPRLVAGGSGSFPLYAELNDPALELSPGTVIFFDEGYRSMFPDLNFTPAALLLTRVVSRPTPNRITLDLGYKAVAGDPPAGRRVTLPQLPDGKEVLHNEEHLVIETDQAEQFQPGDCLLAIPRHICPCSALHRSVFVAREGRIRGIWTVAARDRQLSI
ncbi:MAG: D-TA family PLP-dependent enzyme [Planctomycetales bacterium]|nr:D-TA family PLP-dependent enzyme [Planctomycetales bacterium]